MEVMEDGNLMDKVHILIQRDMEYYKSKQTILQENICPGIIGGRLDFPRSVSFAAMKLVLWWEDEYLAAYRKSSGFLQKNKEISNDNNENSGSAGGVVKTSDPAKFVTSISNSAKQLLEHLHILTQEALDHADLTVLTGTIGAAALLKNCLWFYIQSMNETKNETAGNLQSCYKKYNEMCEALAERLLDLHCRLLSLYILQDAECLDWDSSKPFSESERGSYIIQMWWLYMQGTKEDLWNTVPPKMAQRVFSGMLNESLTILCVRYTQSVPSEARSKLLIVDISNLLLCVAQLLPAICDNAEELVGYTLNNKSKILRDIHTKCQELLLCLLFRGAPLDSLYKVFRKGIENVQAFKSRNLGLIPWIFFALPNVFKEYPRTVLKMQDLPENISITLELMVLLAQPQPNWSLLLKVLCMKNCKILRSILNLALSQYSVEMRKTFPKNETCGAFLCPGDSTCRDVDMTSSTFNAVHYYDLIQSSVNILLCTGNSEDFSEIFISTISKQQNWASCFERRHVWNQIRPPWYEAILNLISPILPTISKTVINAVQTGASMYQAMSLIVACYSQLWECITPALTEVSFLLQDLLPANTIPLNHSVLLQILVSALYTNLLHKSEEVQKEVKFADVPADGSHKNSVTSSEIGLKSSGAIALAVAESLCSIDEDNKHTDQIDEFLEQVAETASYVSEGASRVDGTRHMCEVLVSDLLMTPHGKKSLKTMYHFIKNNNEWLYYKLGVSEEKEETLPNKVLSPPKPLLHTMFHIGYRPFDQILTGEWQPAWIILLQAPMGLTPERLWSQISTRWEFRDINSINLSQHDIHIISSISSLLKQ